MKLTDRLQAISDLGQRCRSCLHEWGFSLLTDQNAEAGMVTIEETRPW